MTTAVAAVDLGASNGRVMVARVDRDRLDLTEVARFPNVPVTVDGTLHWDILRLYRGVLEGLRAAGPVASIGIDSWAIDYGLLDADGRLLGNPIHYRDRRTTGVMDRVLETIPAAGIYATTGIQFLPFNTAYQLVASAATAQLAAAKHLLLIPDLIAYWLTGRITAELTNASTTQLLDARSGHWATDLIHRLGIPSSPLPDLSRPGDSLGPVRADIGLAGNAVVTAVGSHDTASAVAGVPARATNFAYISCGTWSLVGVELDQPILTEDSRRANFSNEAGVDGTVRYLRNVMGLWPLQESIRAWQTADLGGLLREAAARPAFASVVDLDDPAFLAPGDLPGRIADACRRTSEPEPADPPAVVRCILDSLALAHQRAVADACRLSGRDVEIIHLVGGGARNELLCQLTADACGLPVQAGPVEAGALGNALVQARALGAISGDLASIRGLLRATQQIRSYEPAGRAARERAARAQERLTSRTYR